MTQGASGDEVEAAEKWRKEDERMKIEHAMTLLRSIGVQISDFE